MVIQHNISALNAHRNMGINNSGISGNLEKLSSGYRINRAGDDAAGLAISEKMRGQIRGLGMAEQNVSNGVSLIQTAEGGLNETHSILQRMRELAVQSANGTYDSEVDRSNLELEFQELKGEIDRIADSIHYNGIKLLNGNLGAKTKAGTAATAAPVGVTLNATSDVGFLASAAVAGTFAGGAITVTKNGDGTFAVEIDDGASFVASGTIKAGDDSLVLTAGDGSQLTFNLTSDVADKLGNFSLVELDISATGAITDSGNCEKEQSASYSGMFAIGFTDTVVLASANQGEGVYNIAFSKLDNGDYLAKMGDVSTVIAKADIVDGGTIAIGDFELEFDNAAAFTAYDKLEIKGINVQAIDYTDLTDEANYVVDHSSMTVGAGNGLTFQIGANGGDDQRVTLMVDDMGSRSIGLKKGDVKSDGSVATGNAMLNTASIASQDLADKAIDIITGATNMVSAQRAGLGALQNRLESTLNSLGTTKENLTAAESTIRDVDMAKEMMEFTKNNILVQASQAMLAQANQLPQGVLSLLQ